jgi:hypothetical protein
VVVNASDPAVPEAIRDLIMAGGASIRDRQSNGGLRQQQGQCSLLMAWLLTGSPHQHVACLCLWCVLIRCHQCRCRSASSQ